MVVCQPLHLHVTPYKNVCQCLLVSHKSQWLILAEGNLSVLTSPHPTDACDF